MTNRGTTDRDTTIHDTTVFGLLDGAADTWPDRIALGAGDRIFTFRELREEALATAAAFHALGIRPGDRVAVFSANAPEWVFLEFGLARLGAVLVTVNTAFGRDDLAYLLRHAGARVLVHGAEAKGNDLAAVVASLDREALPRLERCVTLEPIARRSVAGSSIAWDDLPRDVADLPDEPVTPDDPINMQYTSGTTGFPKGVVLSSRNIVENSWRTACGLELGPPDRVLCQVPLFHCFGCVVAVLASYTHGASVWLTRTFDPAESLRVIRTREITVVHGVPAMFRALLDADDPDAPPIRTVRTGIMAGAPCPPSLVRRVIETWRAPKLAPGFGLTEASPAVTYNPTDAPLERRVETVGVPLPGTEIRLVDPERGPDDGRDDLRGEMLVRGEQVMLGYHEDEAATAEAVDADGWLRTGDIAERDPDGSYRIVGRIKEMICRGGENVYPAEVEDAVRGIEGVADAAVFGVPDPELGETVACAVVPLAEASLRPSDVVEGLRGRIAKTKIPAVTRVHVVDALPMTASGKVKRYVLTERFGG